jgi:hypothetical protein
MLSGAEGPDRLPYSVASIPTVEVDPPRCTEHRLAMNTVTVTGAT